MLSKIKVKLKYKSWKPCLINDANAVVMILMGSTKSLTLKVNHYNTKDKFNALVSLSNNTFNRK